MAAYDKATPASAHTAAEASAAPYPWKGTTVSTSSSHPGVHAPDGQRIPVEGGLPQPPEGRDGLMTPDIPLADVLHDYGEDWQISAAQGIAGFVAVGRPTVTAVRVLAAPTLGELAAKLSEVTGAGGGDGA